MIFLLSFFYLRSVWLFVFKVSCFCTYPFIVCSSCLSKQTSLWCFSEFKNSCSTLGPNSGKFFNKSRRQNKPQNGQKQIFQICKESLKSILVKLVNLVDSPTIFLSQLTLFRWLKVVSVTVVLFCFAWLNKSTLETRKIVFYFFLEALFVLADVQTWCHQISNLGSKYSLVRLCNITKESFCNKAMEQWPSG